MTPKRPISPIPALEKPRKYLAEVLHPMRLEGNMLKYPDPFEVTKEYLINVGPTLSHKPLTIDHGEVYIPSNNTTTIGNWHTIKLEQSPDKPKMSQHARLLKYPDNRCLEFAYDPTTDSLRGEIQLTDPDAISMIESGEYGGLSVSHNEKEISCLTISSSTPGWDMRARIIGMEPRKPLTSLPLEVKEGEYPKAQTILYAVADKFGLSLDDCVKMGAEATTHLGRAAIHTYAIAKSTTPLQATYHAWEAGTHIAAAALYAVNKQTLDMIQSEANEAYHKLDVIKESCTDPDCMVADTHSHGGGE